MPQDKNQTTKKPKKSKPPMRWISLGVACLALLMTSTNLWFVTQRESTATSKAAHLVSTDTFNQYSQSQQEEELQLILHLADLAKDPSVSLNLYKMALNQAHTPDTIAIIKQKMKTAQARHQPKGIAINTALYDSLNDLAQASTGAFERPTIENAPQQKKPKAKTSAWDKTKQTLLQFVHIQRLPKRELYDTNMAEDKLLAVRMQLQLSLAQWGVLNHRVDIYQSAIKTTKQLATHATEASFIKALNDLPNTIEPESNKKEES